MHHQILEYQQQRPFIRIDNVAFRIVEIAGVTLLICYSHTGLYGNDPLSDSIKIVRTDPLASMLEVGGMFVNIHKSHQRSVLVAAVVERDRKLFPGLTFTRTELRNPKTNLVPEWHEAFLCYEVSL